MTAINSPPLCCGGRIFTDFAMCNSFSKNLGLKDIALSGVGTGLLGSAGYVKIPLIIDGTKQIFILQWGLAAEGSQLTVTYPTAFPNRVAMALATPLTSFSAGVASVAMANLDTLSLTQLNIIVARTLSGSQVAFARSVAWLALGY
ncbi:hypothetical protein WMB67_002064 [Enterobacter hormaechei]